MITISAKKPFMTIVTLAVAAIASFSIAIILDNKNVYAGNCGSYASGYGEGCGGSGNSNARKCSGNSCNSVVYSRATGAKKVTVPASGSIHAPSLDYGSTHYKGAEIGTGDAKPGSTYYVWALYAAKDGTVTIDGQKRQVKAGDVLTYIPFAGLPKSDGTYDSAFGAGFLGGHSDGRYGDLSAAELKSIYNELVRLGKIGDILGSLLDFMGFGGLDDPDKVELVCEIFKYCEPDDYDPPVPLKSCHAGSHYGWTEGAVSVQNITTNTGWQESGEVWARPGDSIQFMIDYCWGVGAVGGSLGNGSSPRAIYPDNGAIMTHEKDVWGVRASGKTIKANPGIWFELSANKNANYFFGKNAWAVSGGQNDLRRRLANPLKETIGATGVGFSNGNVDQTDNYAFKVYSPTPTESASKYACQIFDFSPFYRDYGYQIPGVYTGGCPAISQTGTSSDVTVSAPSISQTIRYNYATAWQLWKHQYSGKCHSQCTHNPEGNSPFTQSTRVAEDNDRNKLTENNPSTEENPFNSMAKAQAGKGNAWGLIDKHRQTTEEYEHDCDSGGCGCNRWRTWYTGCCEYNTDNTCKYSGCWIGCTSNCSDTTCTNAPGKTFHNPQYDYSTGQEELGERTSTASVNVPYSYRTDATSNIQEGDIIYLGEQVSSSFTVSILPRVVTDVRPSEAYATVLPPDTVVRAVEFVVSDSDNLSWADGSGTAYTDPCSFFRGKGASIISACNTIWGDESHLNPEGRYAGTTLSNSVTKAVPDIYPVGSKYCVAVGISSSDSHSQPDTQIVSGMGTPSSWRVSGASCRTIAKKPNFQVWNGGFYTNGGIVTSITEKNVGVGFDVNRSSDPTRRFGSWDEYYVVAAKKIYGFASGAATGYVGKEGNTSLGLWGGLTPRVNNCRTTKMTIANDHCNDSRAEWDGRSGESGINKSMDAVLQKIYSRYIDNSNTSNGIRKLDNGATYVYYKGNISVSDLYKLGTATAPTTISQNYINQAKGSINSQSEQTTSNYASNALVIHIAGKLTIDRNICTGAGTCVNGNDTLVLHNRNSDIYTNIYSLPQILIIASDGIIISENVTQVDAWLITDGNINTCNGLVVGNNNFNDRMCGRQLIVNGPVFAKSLTLSRTSGANPGGGQDDNGNPIYDNLTNDGSIQPAEIFNLRPDTLYWAYSQAQRFSQANVTYLRELAPRY